MQVGHVKDLGLDPDDNYVRVYATKAAQVGSGGWVADDDGNTDKSCMGGGGGRGWRLGTGEGCGAGHALCVRGSSHLPRRNTRACTLLCSFALAPCPQPWHVDDTDIVGLLCLKTAKTGGCRCAPLDAPVWSREAVTLLCLKAVKSRGR